MFERMYAAKITDVRAVKTPLMMEDAPLIIEDTLEVSASANCIAYSDSFFTSSVVSSPPSQSITGAVLMPYFSSPRSHSIIFGKLACAFW